MKQVLFIALAVCLMTAACEKDNGSYMTKNYTINGSYDELEVHNGIEVEFCDTVTEAVVTTRERAHEHLKIEIVEGELRIGFKPTWFVYSGDTKVLLPRIENLHSVELSGASSFVGDLNGNDIDVDLSGASSFVGDLNGNDIDVDLSGASSFKGTMMGSKLSIDLSGASDLSATADVDEADLEASGASEIALTGSCLGEMEIDLSGASTLKASSMDTRSISGNMSGASEAEVSCCESLKVSLSGGSELYYWIPTGCRPFVNCSCSGGSTVNGGK